jgi:hypothetical protein
LPKTFGKNCSWTSGAELIILLILATRAPTCYSDVWCHCCTNI